MIVIDEEPLQMFVIKFIDGYLDVVLKELKEFQKKYLDEYGEPPYSKGMRTDATMIATELVRMYDNYKVIAGINLNADYIIRLDLLSDRWRVAVYTTTYKQMINNF